MEDTKMTLGHARALIEMMLDGIYPFDKKTWDNAIKVLESDK